MHEATSTRVTLLAAAALIVGLGAVAPSRAQDAPDPTAPPSSSTEVKGTLPVDLRGLWLLVSHGALMSQGQVAANKVRTGVELWQIDRKDDGVDVDLWIHDLPVNWRDALDQANAHFQAWTPTDEQVADLAGQLEQLTAGDPDRYLKHLFTLTMPDHYTDADINTGGLSLDGSTFVMRVQHQYRPQEVSEKPQAQLMSDDAIYVVRSATPTRVEGEHTRLILAAGFLPIPVSTQGKFTMYRLRGPENMPSSAKPVGRGFLAQLWDSLSRGCK